MAERASIAVFDADNISGYVFETGRLKEIRGGSYLVRVATEKAVIADLAHQAAATARVVYAGGGAGLVWFPDLASANRFCYGIQNYFRQRTVGGTLTAVAVSVDGPFAETVQKAHSALRQRKAAHPQRDGQTVAGPYTALCISCGTRPVGKLLTVAGRTEALCLTCATRRRDVYAEDAAHTMQRVRRMAAGRISLLDQADLGNDPFAQEFLKQAAGWEDAWLPDQLSDLGELSTPRNYLAFIHADANRMGHHLRAFLTQLVEDGYDDREQEGHYGQFSQAIADVTRQAAVAALMKAFPSPPSRGGQERVPFDNVLLAGDDLVLLVAAQRGLEVAADFCLEFEERMGAKARALGYREPISMAAGVVLTHDNQPILYVQRHAQDLQKSAKQLSDRCLRQGSHVSAIDYAVVTSPVLRPLDLIRSHEYQFYDATNPDGRAVELTRRPYSAQEIKSLLTWGRRLKGLEMMPVENAPSEQERRSYPRSQLRALYAAIFQGYQQGALQGARATLRVNGYQRQMLLEFAREFSSYDPLPWGVDEEVATAFPDLVEIYDFIHASAVRRVA